MERQKITISRTAKDGTYRTSTILYERHVAVNKKAEAQIG